MLGKLPNGDLPSCSFRSQPGRLEQRALDCTGTFIRCSQSPDRSDWQVSIMRQSDSSLAREHPETSQAFGDPGVSESPKR
jgi:hypothetical protein